MKTLLLTFDFPPKRGGISTYAAELAHALNREYPNETLVVAPKANNGSQGTPEANIERIWLPKSALASVFFYIREVNRLLERFPEAEIFCTNWFPCGVAAWISSSRRRKNLPYYIAAHGAEYLVRNSSWSQKIKNWLRSSVTSNAEYVFPVSQYTARKVVESVSNKNSRFKVIPNGVNIEKFRPLESQAFKSSERPDQLPILLSVCRLEPHKGIDTVIEALSLLKKQNFPLEYWIAGSGRDRARLEKISIDFGVESHVRFLGDIPQERLCELYNSCDLFLLLSKELPGSVEGFGLVYLEAAACGKTSIGTLCGGTPDAVIDGETGILIEPGQSERAAEAIKRVLLDLPYRRSLEQRAMNRARTEMSWNQVAKQIKLAMERKVNG